MPKRLYPAVIERGGDGFGVTFPDLPGCTSMAATSEAAFAAAQDAAELYLDDCPPDALPGPTPLEAVVPDPECDVVSVLLIPVEVPGRIKQINITIDEALLAKIDARVKASGWPGRRSGFLAEGARRLLRAEDTA